VSTEVGFETIEKKSIRLIHRPTYNQSYIRVFVCHVSSQLDRYWIDDVVMKFGCTR
jgi:hypothetical protein